MNCLVPGTKVRVKSLDKIGTVVYCRMGPPDWSRAVCYSIKLGDQDHVGAIFSAEDIEKLND